MENRNPIVIVPGFLGSSLEDFCSVEPKSLWSEWGLVDAVIGTKGVFDLALDRSGRLDSALDVVTRANGLIGSAYGSLASSLRSRELAPAVYLFPYDWRLSTAITAQRLARFVEVVRAKLLTAFTGWSGKIDFVTHSFGGLVFRAFLREYQHAAQHVGRVVFIAVPHQGTLFAVDAMVRGVRLWRKELRKVARTFPGLYELLPTYSEALVDSRGQAVAGGFFDLANWQRNVTAIDVAEANGFDVLPEHLQAAQAQIAAWRDPREVVSERDMLTIYGADSRSTLATIRASNGGRVENWFDFDGPLGDGDTVVTASSALSLKRVPAIALSTAQASLFTETRAHLSLHSFIPSLDETQSIIARFLAGERKPEGLLPHNVGLERFHIP